MRKFYGTYFHNITSHAPIQNCLISGRSANTEEQERIFNAITNITCTMSSFHPDHVVSNILVRLQAEKDFSTNQHHASSVEKQQAHVSKLASSLPGFPNTVIPKDMLVNHPSSWQAHLERISDFLLVGKGFWWNKSVKMATFIFLMQKEILNQWKLVLCFTILDPVHLSPRNLT